MLTTKLSFVSNKKEVFLAEVGLHRFRKSIKIEQLIRSDKDEIKHILERYEEERKAKLMAYEANENLNEDLANIFQDIEKSAIGFKSEDDIKGLFDNLDTRSNILGGTVPEKNKRLSDILNWYQ